MITKEEIAVVDSEGMFGIIAGLQRQIKEGVRLAAGIKVLDEVNDVIIAGMGGSALPGEVLKSLLIDSKVKLTISKDYTLPNWANNRTLVVAISYSGNTEETLSALKDAIKKSCRIVCVASGGKLEELAKKNKIQFIKVPQGMQPRAAIGLQTFAVIGLLQNSRIIPDMSKDIEKTESALNVENFTGKAMDLAEQLVDKIPLIYTSEKLASAGYKWKIAFNENAKTHAFFNVYPEMNHNEINAFVNIKAKFHVIMLSNDTDHLQVKKRMQITKELYKSRGVDVTEIAIKGDSMLTKIFSAIMIGDLVSFYLAVKYKTDPTYVKMVEDLKKQL